jgi:hypothetical protein
MRDPIASGMTFLASPDLVGRLQRNLPLTHRSAPLWPLRRRFLPRVNDGMLLPFRKVLAAAGKPGPGPS